MLYEYIVRMASSLTSLFLLALNIANFPIISINRFLDYILTTVLTMRVPPSVATLPKLVFSEMQNPNYGTITHHFTILVASPNVLATRRSVYTAQLLILFIDLVATTTWLKTHGRRCDLRPHSRRLCPAPSYRSASAIALSFGVPARSPTAWGSLMWLSGSPSCIVASMTDMIYPGNQFHHPQFV
jgi:hypothetical protein